MADIKYLISVDSEGAVSKIKQFDEAIDKLGPTQEKAGRASTSMAGDFIKAQLTVEGLKKGFGLLKDFMVDCVTEFADGELADQKLRTSLELTGRTVEGNLKHYKDFAEEQQRVTLFTDDEIEKAQALMLTMVDLDQKGMDRAMKGAMGLSSAMGKDLQQATIQVAKAMGGQVESLKEVGIRISATLPPAEQKAEALRKLEKLYGLSAGATKTFSGALTQFNKDVSDAKEALGKMVVSGTGATQALKDFGTIIKGIPLLLEEMEGKLLASGGSLFTNFRAWGVILSIVAGKVEDLSEKYRKQTEFTEALKEKKYSLFQLIPAMVKSWGDYDQALGLLPDKHKKIIESTGGASDAFQKFREKLEAGWKALASGEKALAGVDWDLKVFEKDLASGADALKEISGGMVIFSKITGYTSQDVSDDIDQILSKFNLLKKKGGQDSKALAEEMQRNLLETLAMFNEALNTISGFFSAMAGMSKANADSEIADLDRGYEWRKKLIEDSTMSEEEKNKKMEELDKEYALKKKTIQREVAQQQKNSAIIEAMINTAVAFTKALTATIPPFNYILAAATLAMGYMQITAIKNSPIPMAKGGILDRPTISGNGGFLGGEAGAEAVIPISDKAKRRASQALEGGAGPTVIHNSIFLDKKKLAEQIIEIVEDASERRGIRIKSWAVN